MIVSFILFEIMQFRGTPYIFISFKNFNLLFNFINVYFYIIKGKVGFAFN